LPKSDMATGTLFRGNGFAGGRRSRQRSAVFVTARHAPSLKRIVKNPEQSGIDFVQDGKQRLRRSDPLPDRLSLKQASPKHVEPGIPFMPTTPLIAVLTDDHQLASTLCVHLQDQMDVRLCSPRLSDVVDEVSKLRPAAVVLDFTNPSAGGHAEERAVVELQERFPKLRLVLVTGEDCPEPLARRATCTELIHICEQPPADAVIAAAHRVVDVDPPQSTDAEPGGIAPACGNGEGVSTGLRRRFETRCTSLQWMLQELEVAALHDVSILLIGETGVGKTYLSRLIHEISPRRSEPFVTVACGALPGELIESELFGHKKGAFTGAHADKQGKFVAAGGGTMLLDEIDVLGLEQQVKLLRVIETGEFEPLGCNITVTSRARLVVASNLDLQPLVEQGRFRPDLYYRLNMLKFELPPLRERVMDIEPLARKMIVRLSRQHRVCIDSVDTELIDALQRYPWPGNVRELENVLRRSVIFCRDGHLSVGQLAPHILQREPGPANDSSVVLQSARRNGEASAKQTLGGRIEHTEREIIQQALSQNNHSRTKTAKDLGISRVTLYNKMRKYNLA